MCTSIFDGEDDNIDGYCMSMQTYYQASETTVQYPANITWHILIDSSESLPCTDGTDAQYMQY